MKSSSRRTVPIEVSARHVHLTRVHVQKLFGRGARLTRERGVSQPGQFVCKQRVTLSNEHYTLSNVGIVGPERGQTQVELAMTDARHFHLTPRVRVSGELRGTNGGLTIHGPHGSVALHSSVIIAKRHVHASPTAAKAASVQHGERVSIRITNRGGVRDITLHDVIVRVHKKYTWTLHLDTDEANAAGVTAKSRAVMISA